MSLKYDPSLNLKVNVNQLLHGKEGQTISKQLSGMQIQVNDLQNKACNDDNADNTVNFQVQKILKILKPDDYDHRMCQIIDAMRLNAIKLKIPQNLKQKIVKTLMSPQSQIKQTDLLLAKSNQAIYYKNHLYLAKRIVLKIQKPSNFGEKCFDLNIFSPQGQILCSLHNFSKVQRLVKTIQIKFRRLSAVLYLQMCQQSQPQTSFFYQLKKHFTMQVSRVFLRQPLGLNTNQTLEQTHNEKLMNKQQFTNCSDQPQNKETTQNAPIQPNPYFPKQRIGSIIDLIRRKQQFDNLVLDQICLFNQNKKQYRRRNQITIRFINYAYLSFIQIPNQTLNLQTVRICFSKIIQHMYNNKKIMLQISVRNNKMTNKHFPRALRKGFRVCLWCKQKNKYFCIGCSARFRNKIPLCLSCFQPFHSQQNLIQALPMLMKMQKSSRKQHQQYNLGKSVQIDSMKGNQHRTQEKPSQPKADIPNQSKHNQIKDGNNQTQQQKQFELMKSHVCECYQYVMKTSRGLI